MERGNRELCLSSRSFATTEEPQCDSKRANLIRSLPFSLLCKGTSVDLNDGTCVDTSSPEVIVAYAKCDDHYGDKSSVVHILRRDRQLGWPHAEKDDDGQVHASEGVDCYTVHAWYVPRSKCQFSIRVITNKSHTERHYAASTASVEEKARGDQIRRIERRNGDVDQIIKGGRRSQDD